MSIFSSEFGVEAMPALIAIDNFTSDPKKTVIVDELLIGKIRGNDALPLVVLSVNREFVPLTEVIEGEREEEILEDQRLTLSEMDLLKQGVFPKPITQEVRETQGDESSVFSLAFPGELYLGKISVNREPTKSSE